MATKVIMPKLSPTMEEGQISRWLKKEGDKVSMGEPLAEIDTDKATMEMQALGNGVLRKILIGEGQSAPLGQLIAVIGEPDEDIAALLSDTPPAQPQPQPQCSSSALLCSDNDAGASIVKGSRGEVCIASPFDFKDKVCWYGSCSSGVSLSRHRHPSA